MWIIDNMEHVCHMFGVMQCSQVGLIKAYLVRYPTFSLGDSKMKFVFCQFSLYFCILAKQGMFFANSVNNQFGVSITRL